MSSQLTPVPSIPQNVRICATAPTWGSKSLHKPIRCDLRTDGEHLLVLDPRLVLEEGSSNPTDPRRCSPRFLCICLDHSTGSGSKQPTSAAHALVSVLSSLSLPLAPALATLGLSQGYPTLLTIGQKESLLLDVTKHSFTLHFLSKTFQQLL